MTAVAKAKTTVTMAIVRSPRSATDGAQRCSGQPCFPQLVTQERGHTPLFAHPHTYTAELWPHRSATLSLEQSKCSQNQHQPGMGHGQGWELSLGTTTAGSWLWVMLCRSSSSSQALGVSLLQTLLLYGSPVLALANACVNAHGIALR